MKTTYTIILGIISVVALTGCTSTLQEGFQDESKETTPPDPPSLPAGDDTQSEQGTEEIKDQDTEAPSPPSLPS